MPVKIQPKESSPVSFKIKKGGKDYPLHRNGDSILPFHLVLKDSLTFPGILFL
jgi:hypothetical protein